MSFDNDCISAINAESSAICLMHLKPLDSLLSNAGCVKLSLNAYEGSFQPPPRMKR